MSNLLYNSYKLASIDTQRVCASVCLHLGKSLSSALTTVSGQHHSSIYKQPTAEVATVESCCSQVDKQE